MQEPQLYESNIGICVAQPAIAIAADTLGIWILPTLCAWVALVVG